MNSMRAIITFLLIMWVMILLAGVAVIYVIGSISVTGYGDIDGLATVALKGLGAIICNCNSCIPEPARVHQL